MQPVASIIAAFSAAAWLTLGASDAAQTLGPEGVVAALTVTGAALADIDDKVIVLTGAMQPARFRDSDALFNLGLAIGALNTLGHGVYVAMSGRIFPVDQVRKNRLAGRFEGL